MEKTWMDYQTDAYERELDAAAEILGAIHPLGRVKAIGRREVVAALRDVAAELISFREIAASLREAAIDVASERARCRCNEAVEFDDETGAGPEGPGDRPDVTIPKGEKPWQ